MSPTSRSLAALVFELHFLGLTCHRAVPPLDRSSAMSGPPANSDSSNASKQKEAVTLFTGSFRDFSTGLVSSMKEIHALAKDRATTFLYALGTTVLILALFLRLKPFGITVSDMQPAEFITIYIL